MGCLNVKWVKENDCFFFQRGISSTNIPGHIPRRCKSVLNTIAQGSLLVFSLHERVCAILLFMCISVNHVLRLSLFCLSFFFLPLILKFKDEIISFLSFSVHFQAINYILLLFRFYKQNEILPLCIGDLEMICWYLVEGMLGEYGLELQHLELCFNKKLGGKCLSAELFVWKFTFEILGGQLVSTAWKICSGKMFLLLKIKIIFFSSRKYFVPSQKAKSTAFMIRGGVF